MNNVTTGAISLQLIEQFSLKLGTGNDVITLSTTPTNTSVTVDGGGGDDQITVNSIGLPETNLIGNSGQDTVTVVINGVPVANGFTTLNLSTDTLVVDNRNNSDAGINWTLVDGALLTANGLNVLNTAGAAVTQIRGGTRNDTLNVVTNTSNNIEGSIDGNRVELKSGLVVLEHFDFATTGNFDAAIDFDELTGTTNSYSEHGFTLSSTGTIQRDNTLSPAAKATGSTNVFALKPTTVGSAFAFYSIDLALASGTQAVTFTGKTLNGGTVTHTVTVIGGTGFTRFNLPATFTALASVDWTPNAVLVDNLVANSLAFPNVTAAPAIAAIAKYTLSSNITFNTNTGQLTAGQISIDTDGNGTIDRTLGVGVNLNQFGITVTQTTNSISQFAFAGDLIVLNNAVIRATGSRGLSLLAGNNVNMGTGVSFDLSATGSTAGSGGGNGASTIGSGGVPTNGGSGGIGRTGGAGGGGGATQYGRGNTAAVGTTGGNGSNGSSNLGGIGSAGSIGINGGTGGAGGGQGTRGTGGGGNFGGAGGDRNNFIPAGQWPGRGGEGGVVGDPGFAGDFGSNGLNGADGNTGGTGGTGGNGTNGGTGLVISGGSGGSSGGGSAGGAGGTGGGGGGAGGTVKLYGTNITADGVKVDTSGGNSTMANNGRFIFGTNTATGLILPANRIGTNYSQVTGQRNDNTFIADGTADENTPLIAGLQGGSELYGLLGGLTASSLDYDLSTPGVQQAPSDTLVAIFRLDLGLTGYNTDYAGFDMLLYVNVTDKVLANPNLGIILSGSTSTTFTQGLLTGGFRTDTTFGGTGTPQALTSFNPGAIWATLVPDATNLSVRVNASITGPATTLNLQNLIDNQVAYLRATKPNLTTTPELPGLRSIVVSPDGKQIYGVNKDQNALVVINANDLSQRQLFKDELDGITSLAGASDLRISPDGKTVYVSSATDNSITVFNRDLTAGNLNLVQVAISPAGAESLAIGNTRGYAVGADRIFAFDRNPTTRLLTAAGAVSQLGGIANFSDVAVNNSGNSVYAVSRTSDANASTGQLQFAQVLRNNVGGTTGLRLPNAIVANGNKVYVASQFQDGFNGGVVVFDNKALNSTPPAPISVITTFDGIENLTVSTSGGNDNITLRNGANVETTIVNMGSGNDLVSLLSLTSTTTVNLGVGNDAAQIRSENSGTNLTVRGDSGNDTIDIDRVGSNARVEVFGDDDRDIVRVIGSNLPISATTIAHGNNGTDTLIFDPQNPNPNVPNYNPAPPPSGQGNVAVTSRGTLQYDTFEGPVTVIAAPVINFASFRIDEGQNVTLTATVTALGSTNTLKEPITWDLNGDGRYNDAIGNNIVVTWEQLKALGINDNGIYPISVRAINQDNLAAEAFNNLRIDNTAPTIALTGNNSVAVGLPYQLDFSAFDPGNDRISSWRVNWGDGSPLETFGSGTTSATRIYNTPGNFSIQVTAIDEDSSFLSPTKPITVSVGATQVNAGNAYTIAEGDNLTLSATAAGTPQSFDWDLNNDGVFGDVTGSNPTVTWAALQALSPNPIRNNGSYNLRVRTTYTGGTTATSNPVVLTVVNTAPTGTFGNSGAIAEGGSVSVNWSNVTDPSLRDTTAGFLYSYDFNNDGTFEITDSNQASAVVPAQFVKDKGIRTVRSLVRDVDGGITERFTDITIQEVAPTLIVTGNDTAVEGSNYILNLSATDPGNDSISRWIVDWNDGTITTVDGATQALTHQFADNGSRNIAVQAIDSDGIYTANKAVNVSNAAPNVQNLAATNSTEGDVTTLTGTIADPGRADSFSLTVNWGESFTLNGSFTDIAALDTHTVSIAWGDGTTSEATVNPTTRTFTATHQYASSTGDPFSQEYAIVATAIDDDGGTANGGQDTFVQTFIISVGIARVGTTGNDVLNGTSFNDYLDGGSGNLDRIFGGAGDDILVDADGVNGAQGGAGNDTIDITFAANWDNDTNATNSPRSDGKIAGGFGDDNITVTMNRSNFFLNMKGDEPTSSPSQDGNDTVTLQGSYGNAIVDMGGGNDTFNGGVGGDSVSGGNGNDILNGGNGSDTLTGGSGNDTLNGGIGSDTLRGGTGDDNLTGGGGSDTFTLATGEGIDSVVDFENTIDRIGLAGGLTFSQLLIDRVDNRVRIRVAATGEVLGYLEGIDSSLIGAEDFKSF